MGSNLPFLVARRRNEHRLHGAAFLASLAGKLDIPSDQLSLIAPDRSVALEAGVYSYLKSGISLGEVAAQHLSSQLGYKHCSNWMATPSQSSLTTIRRAWG
jgi:hypothetical protein